ncbi:MAG: hypothetical protein ABI683_05535 [Ginsengibacter sp.]
MDLSEFKNSTNESAPPKNISVYLNALWYDKKGDWSKSHSIIQDVNDKTASWIHAYLHRKEGDEGNAGYWYSRAAKRFPEISLEKEWDEIVTALL